MCITLSVTKKGTDIFPLSWPDNPFGLEQWATQNVKYAVRDYSSLTCSLRSTFRLNPIDPQLFKEAVSFYGKIIQELTDAYFWFTTGEMLRMGIAYQNTFPRLGIYLGIPMKRFKSISSTQYTISKYKSWYQELEKIADILQYPDVTYFYAEGRSSLWK